MRGALLFPPPESVAVSEAFALNGRGVVSGREVVVKGRVLNGGRGSSDGVEVGVVRLLEAEPLLTGQLRRVRSPNPIVIRINLDRKFDYQGKGIRI